MQKKCVLPAATKDSWNNKTMPEKNVIIPMDEWIPAELMGLVRYGFIPQGLEDHWFVYCDESSIRFFRSWSGDCIFVGRFTDEDGGSRITELQVNRDPSQYTGTDDDSDVAMFLALVTGLYGGNADNYWKKVK